MSDDLAVKTLLERATRKAGQNPIMLQFLKEQMLEAGGRMPGGPPGPSFPSEEQPLNPEQLDILTNIRQGGYGAEAHRVPFSRDMMSDQPSSRIKVTRPGFPQQGPGEFPLSGLEDVGGQFAVGPTAGQNPVLMAAIQRFLQSGRSPQIPLDEMNIEPPNPYEGLGLDLRARKQKSRMSGE